MVVYPNLEKQMKQRTISYTDLANLLNVTTQDVLLKMTGSGDFTLKEAIIVVKNLYGEGVYTDIANLFLRLDYKP